MVGEASNGPNTPEEGPGGTLMGWRGITVTALYLVLVTVVVLHGLVVLWPPDRGNVAKAAAPGGAITCEAGADDARFMAWKVCLYPEERLFLIVLFAGALGGLVHMLRSFSWYLGNRKLVTSWMARYFTIPVVGAAMAVMFYLVIRGGFTPSDSNFDRTNPFGFAAMAVLVGMFSEQAAERLKEVAEMLFAKVKPGRDHAPPDAESDGTPATKPTVTGVDPGGGGAGLTVKVTGTGFVSGAVVRFGDNAATGVTVTAATTLEAQTPEAATAGPVTVEVINPDGQAASLAEGFTYE